MKITGYWLQLISALSAVGGGLSDCILEIGRLPPLQETDTAIRSVREIRKIKR